MDTLHETIITIDDEDMTISYSGDYDRVDTDPNNGSIASEPYTKEQLVINYAVEDLLIVVSGQGIFNIDVSWDSMPPNVLPDHPSKSLTTTYGDTLSIQTQDNAQHALTQINDAIEAKDKVRAHLGALQNRLENTISNLSIQAENLQASESRISDVDVATEMMRFVRSQILTQTGVAMLSQANALPQAALQLING